MAHFRLLVLALSLLAVSSRVESAKVQTEPAPEFPGKFNANNYLPPDPLAPAQEQQTLPAIPVLDPLPVSGGTLPASPAERIALRLSMQGTPVDYTAELENLASLVKKQKHWLESANIIKSRIEEQINDQETEMQANQEKMNELKRVMEEENNAIHREKLLTMVENANSQVKLLKDQISSMMPSPQADALAHAVAEIESRLNNLASKTTAPVPVPHSDAASAVSAATPAVVPAAEVPSQPLPDGLPSLPVLEAVPSVLDASTTPAPVDLSATPAPVDPLATPAPVDASATPAPVDASATPAPVDPLATPAPVDAAATEVPVDAAAPPAASASLLEHSAALTAQNTATAASAARLVRAEAAAERAAVANQQAVEQGVAISQASNQVEELTRALEEARSQLATTKAAADQSKSQTLTILKSLLRQHHHIHRA